jgi:hypothetical protein
MKVKDLVKKLLEQDQDKEIELSTELIDALDISPIVNNRKFPTRRDKIVFTYKRNDILPLSFHLYYYDARINKDYHFRLIRKMAVMTSHELRWHKFRTSIGCWNLNLRNNTTESTRP